jgi:hypothetical protein
MRWIEDRCNVASRVAQNWAMETNLTVTAVKAALAEISDVELAALITATYGVTQTAPGLLAWIDSACDWESHRRRDFDYPLQPPEAAIQSEREVNRVECPQLRH